MHLPTLTNETLVARLERLAQSERKLQIEVLRLLAELDGRQVVVRMGYSGLWDFCRRRLKFSEATATRRVNVARASRRFPEILTMLEDGRLNLGSAAELITGLNDTNAQDLLSAAAGRSRREVQKLVIPAGEKAPVHDVIRRVAPTATQDLPSLLPLVESPIGDSSVEKKAPQPSPIEPSKVVTHRVAFSAGDDVVSKLEKLQELLGGATLAEVVDRAADVLLAQVDPVKRHERREQRAKKKTAKGTHKAPVNLRPTEPRRPPRALADRVVVEAGQQCAYVSPDGVRCTETRYLTIDHIRPYALGGKSTDIENQRCFCSAHNLMAGRQSFPRGVRT